MNTWQPHPLKFLILPVIIILCSGIFFLGKGLYIPVKAFIARILLEDSWNKVQRGEQNVKPWPWADFKPVFCLYFPDYHYKTIVVNSASGTSLAFGPGQMDGSVAPGKKGNTVIIGHRDTHFSVLQHLAPGDPIHLTTTDGTLLRYYVSETAIINKNDTIVMNSKEKSLITLITCYPFRALLPGDMRYVVFAVQEKGKSHQPDKKETFY